MLIESLGGKRFLLALSCNVMTAALQAWGKLDAGGVVYGAVVAGTVGAYITGNTIELVKGLTTPKVQA